MKKKIFLSAAILSLALLSACTKASANSDIKQGSIVKGEESKVKDEESKVEKEKPEETKKQKIEKHEEDWQLIYGVGEADWNANMPKVGKFAFYNDIYVPNVLGEEEKPYFFLAYTTIGRENEALSDMKRAKNLEETPEVMMGIDEIWKRILGSISTMQVDTTDEEITPVIETKKKLTIDDFDFMRVTGKFEISDKNTKELLRERKYIAYFYNCLDSPSAQSRAESEGRTIDTFSNDVFIWAEGYIKDTEGKDFNVVIETADKIMSTFKLDSEQREYLEYTKSKLK